MTDLSRRDLIKGAGAVMAIGISMPAAAATPAMDAASRELKQWVYRYTIHYRQAAVLKTDYDLYERVVVKFLTGKNDKRKFGAQSLQEADGKIIARIPSNAVPWCYIRNRADIPLKFRMKVERSKLWTRTSTGKLFVVKTKQGIAIVPAHRIRSREAVGTIGRVGTPLAPEGGK